MEQALLTDQDNALVYLEDSDEARDYFGTLADRVKNDLLRAGFPPCPGGYMATNWHRPLDEWIQLFKGWVETPDPQALLETAIFFDFRPVHGALSLEPLEQIIQEARKRHIFLGQLARSALEFRPPLGFFRRIIRDEDGRVDLKAGGVAPIVSLARVYALEAGARTRSTFMRLEAAAEANTLSQEGAETLAETYRFLLQLRLREQLATVQAGGIPDNKIRLQTLSPRENRHLKDAFLAIREMQDATSHRFRTDHLG
jgi:CBS domain-containing protein